jgi:hypothetical protein
MIVLGSSRNRGSRKSFLSLLAAEYRGISIEQLFKQEPERYKQYRRLVLEE